MNFLDQIKDLCNKALGLGFTTDHSEAEVLRALDTALAPVKSMSNDLEGVNTQIQDLMKRIEATEKTLEAGFTVDTSAIETQISEVRSSIPDLTSVNERIESIAGEVAAIKANKPLQKEANAAPLKPVVDFKKSIEITFKKDQNV